ncbi:hypothetical protein FQN54_007468 [Arachnomyces sp. PD_36]|nr:hypothetical protein FQN54_007468 [Arachnomyces sp. PD_36]
MSAQPTENSPKETLPAPAAAVLPPPCLTPEQKKKIQSLTTKITTLTTQISTLTNDLETGKEKLSAVLEGRTSHITPQQIVQRHIRLLHEYNEIKDIAQGLMGMIADGRGVRHIVVQREFGVGGDD